MKIIISDFSFFTKTIHFYDSSWISQHYDLNKWNISGMGTLFRKGRWEENEQLQPITILTRSFVTFNSRLYRYEIEFLILQSGGEHASSILILSFTAWSRSYSWKYFKFQRWKRKERISIFSISSFTLRSSKLSTRFIEKYFQINRVKLREFIKECQILPLLSFDKLFIREKKRCLIHQLDSKSYPNTFLFDLVFLKRSLATNHITFSISRHCIDKIGKRTKTKLQKWLSSSLDKTCSPRGCAFVKINWPMDNFALVVFLRRISI